MAYSNSPLVAYTKISPNRTSPRNHAIDRITIHCVVGQVTAEALGSVFAPTSRGASSNYGVDKDGRIGMYCEEKDRSWCSSSRENDHRAITIETASDTSHPYAVRPAAYNALIDLCVDICRRNGKNKLLWFGDKNTALNYSPKSNEMVMTVHRWFANTLCPGQYLLDRQGAIADAVNARLGSGGGSSGGGSEGGGSEGGDSGGTSGTVDPDNRALAIWAYLMEKIGNEYGVAGLMGNLDAESGLHPDRVQGDIPYSNFSKEYTAKVDSGEISESSFVNNGPNGNGYGLAQWTYYTRKQGLYNMYKSGGYSSIGSLDLALDYLWYELQNRFPGVLSVLQNASSIREASDKVLHDFEAPADQSTAVEETRESFGVFYFNLFSGTDVDYDDLIDNDGLNKKNLRKLSKLLLFAVASDFF